MDDCRVTEGYVRSKIRKLFRVGRWEIGAAVLNMMDEELTVKALGIATTFNNI